MLRESNAYSILMETPFSIYHGPLPHLDSVLTAMVVKLGDQPHCKGVFMRF